MQHRSSPSISGYLVLLVSSLLLLGAAELIAPLLFPLPERADFNRAYFSSFDAWIKQGIAPTAATTPIRNVDLTWISEPDEYRGIISLNLYGFRGPNFSIAPPTDKRRVLFIGDSYVEGYGTDNQRTIPVLLERQLTATNPIEAINLGIGGNGVKEYEQLMKVAIPLLQPKIVVLLFCFNDFPFEPSARSLSDIQQTESYRSPLYLWDVMHALWSGTPPGLFFQRGPVPFFLPVPSTSNPLSTKSFKEIPEKFLAPMRQGTFNPYLPLRLREIEKLLQQSIQPDATAALERIITFARERKVQLLTGFIPLHVTVSDKYYQRWKELGANFSTATLTAAQFRTQQRELNAFFQTHNIPFLDTTTTLEHNERSGIQSYLGYDDHLNSRGYQLIAEQLAPFLSK